MVRGRIGKKNRDSSRGRYVSGGTWGTALVRKREIGGRTGKHQAIRSEVSWRQPGGWANCVLVRALRLWQTPRCLILLISTPSVREGGLITEITCCCAWLDLNPAQIWFQRHAAGDHRAWQPSLTVAVFGYLRHKGRKSLPTAWHYYPALEFLELCAVMKKIPSACLVHIHKNVMSWVLGVFALIWISATAGHNF